MTGTVLTALGIVALIVWGLAVLVRGRSRRKLEVLSRDNAVLSAEIESRSALLRDTNARLGSIIDSAVDGIVVIDHRGNIEVFNRGAERIFGYAAAEVTGQNVSMLMPSPYHEEHDDYLARYLATGEPRIIGIGRAVTGRRRDGTTVPLHLSVGEMLVGADRKFTGILHDMTSRTRMEEQLREQASLARLGEMASLIAHEVKNPLAAVRGAIQVMGSRKAAGSVDADIVPEILRRLDALDHLVDDLLLFARPPTPRVVSVDVVRLLSMSVDLLKQDPAFSGVEIAVDGSAPAIAADPGMLTIVFQNLLVNGAQAVNGSGRIVVAVDARDEACRITVADTGPGIAPEIRRRMFTPFFTTKARGSGLGLPTARRLVEAHHGTLAVDCPPAGGTVVTVRLPMPS